MVPSRWNNLQTAKEHESSLIDANGDQRRLVFQKTSYDAPCSKSPTNPLAIAPLTNFASPPGGFCRPPGAKLRQFRPTATPEPMSHKRHALAGSGENRRISPHDKK
jgi:hypothetical protein